MEVEVEQDLNHQAACHKPWLGDLGFGRVAPRTGPANPPAAWRLLVCFGCRPCSPGATCCHSEPGRCWDHRQWPETRRGLTGDHCRVAGWFALHTTPRHWHPHTPNLQYSTKEHKQGVAQVWGCAGQHAKAGVGNWSARGRTQDNTLYHATINISDSRKSHNCAPLGVTLCSTVMSTA